MAARSSHHVFFSNLQLHSSLTSSKPAGYCSAQLLLLAATAG
jgi:hypothetical protein